ncbi:uncharacterized protein LOC142977515 [Anticarsia gemmatalis]|uniref:uncharacterized protein LOC142977515 n=1 Tax=Anticarsia gemmatalis TaxID=129554 RepID=UPI003F75AD74
MVRISMMLARTPVIKFRKGGLGARPAAPSGGAPAPAAAAPASAPGSCAPAAAISTSSIPDIDLPQRYRRTPLSQEEIDHINGGGIV